MPGILKPNRIKDAHKDQVFVKQKIEIETPTNLKLPGKQQCYTQKTTKAEPKMNETVKKMDFEQLENRCVAEDKYQKTVCDMVNIEGPKNEGKKFGMG